MAIIDNLRVSKESLNTAINTFGSRRTELENSYLKISNEVRVLDGTWNGEASEKFKTQFEALYKNMQQADTVMENVITNLKSALEVYTAQEEAVSGLINNAAEGTAYTPSL